MSARHLLLLGSLVLAACAAPRPAPQVGCSFEVDPTARPAVSAAAWTAGAELYVRMNRDLGPEASPVGTRFTATVVEPLVDPHGIVVVPVGSLVHGQVVAIDAEQRRIAVAFCELQTKRGVFALQARVLAVWPYALTVRPPDGDLAHAVVLQSATPTAIGGGPPAEDIASESVHDIVVPFDAELRLQVVAPLIEPARESRE